MEHVHSGLLLSIYFTLVLLLLAGV